MYGSWRALAGLSLLAIAIVEPLLFWDSTGSKGGGGTPPNSTHDVFIPQSNLSHSTAAVTHRQGKRSIGGERDVCLEKYGGVSLVYTMGHHTGFRFDLCSVINCGRNKNSWRGYDVYMCDSYSGGPSSGDNGWCPHWGCVLWGTGPHYESDGYVQKRPSYSNTAELQAKGSLQRTMNTGGGNPLVFSLNNENNTVYFVLGVDQSGKDTMGLIKVTFLNSSSVNISTTPAPVPSTYSVTDWKNASSMVWSRADLFWYCGGRNLFLHLVPGWSGTCTLTRLTLPLSIIGGQPVHFTHTRRHRQTFDPTHNSPTYIDAIGIPRGVPDECKLADQVAAGFENIPFIGAFIPITPNKNVDRINYVHYNVLRLTNPTRDAIAGLSEQLSSTSLMTVQNKMALDMLLAEKGGVCSMFGEVCCTFILNNTAPDGSVTRALEGLRTLSEEMHENSGISNPFADWMEKVLGKWKNLVVSLFTSILAVLACLVFWLLCCIPCARSLCERMIVTAIKGQGKEPPPYQLPLCENIPLMTQSGEPNSETPSEDESDEIV
uniref:Envelope protein n=1 Tax=Mola mola TaxID=94237 RepID=A0A3Q4BLK2_MOLML